MRLLCLLGAVAWGLVGLDFAVGFFLERSTIRLVFLLMSYGGCVACLQRGGWVRPGPLLDVLVIAGCVAGFLCVFLLAGKLAQHGLKAFKRG